MTYDYSSPAALFRLEAERGPAVRAAEHWRAELAARDVTLDPVLWTALREASRAVDRSRVTDTGGARLAYAVRELRAAWSDVVAQIPARNADPFADLLASLSADVANNGERPAGARDPA